MNWDEVNNIASELTSKSDSESSRLEKIRAIPNKEKEGVSQLL